MLSLKSISLAHVHSNYGLFIMAGAPEDEGEKEEEEEEDSDEPEDVKPRWNPIAFLSLAVEQSLLLDRRGVLPHRVVAGVSKPRGTAAGRPSEAIGGRVSPRTAPVVELRGSRRRRMVRRDCPTLARFRRALDEVSLPGRRPPRGGKRDCRRRLRLRLPLLSVHAAASGRRLDGDDREACWLTSMAWLTI